MAVNQWLNSPSAGLQGEMDVMQDLVDENIAAGGVDVKYLVRSEENASVVFGEATIAGYKEAFEIEMYIANVQNFHGDGELFGKFGIEANDSATLIVSKRRFLAEATSVGAPKEPKSGDIIYMPMTKTVWEITRPKRDEIYNAFGDWYSYRLEVKLYVPTHENVESKDFTQESLGQDIQVDDFSLERLLGVSKLHTNESEDLKELGREVTTNKLEYDVNDPFGEEP